MFGFRNIVFAIFLCVALYGCATIFNGSTQDVLIVAPPGTTVRDTNEVSIPMLHYDFNQNFIKLKRNRDYVLRFKNEDQEIQTKAPRSIGAGWVIVDLLPYIAPILVDWWTKDWYSFEDLKIHFANDSAKNKIQASYVESYEPVIPSRPDTIHKIGGVFFAGVGTVVPANQIPLFFTGYEMGFGYSIVPNWEIIVSGSLAFDLSLTDHDAGTSSTSAGLSLEGRYNVHGLYALAGAGWAHISSDTIKYSEQFFDSSLQGNSYKYLTLSPVNKSMPNIFVGIGYFGEIGFIELRHTFGLSKIQFSNGERNSFATTALNFGFNVHF